MINKNLFIFILIFLLLTNFSLAEEFKINNVAYTKIYFYDCYNGTLNTKMFSSLVHNLQNDKNLNQYYKKWGDDKFISNGTEWIFGVKESRFFLQFNEKTTAYISVTPKYWLVNYYLDSNGSIFNLGNSLNSASIKTNVDLEHTDQYIERNIVSNKLACSSNLISIMINVYGYNSSIKCLEENRDVYGCLNDINYNRLIEDLSQDISRTPLDRIHEYQNNHKIVLDKRALNEDITASLTRLVVISNSPIIYSGIIPPDQYADHIKYLINLRKMPNILYKLNILNNECKFFLNISENKLKDLRISNLKDKFFYWFGQSISTNNLTNQMSYCSTETEFLSEIPNNIKKDLELNENFYITYYKKYTNYYLQGYQDILKILSQHTDNLKLNIENIKSIDSNKKDTSLALFIALFATIVSILAAVVQIFLQFKNEKKTNSRFTYFQNKLNEIIRALNQNKQRRRR